MDSGPRASRGASQPTEFDDALFATNLEGAALAGIEDCCDLDVSNWRPEDFFEHVSNSQIVGELLVDVSEWSDADFNIPESDSQILQALNVDVSDWTENDFLVTQGTGDAGSQPNLECIYPSLANCQVPVAAISHLLAQRRFMPVLVDRLRRMGIFTISDLAKLTRLRAKDLDDCMVDGDSVSSIRYALCTFEQGRNFINANEIIWGD